MSDYKKPVVTLNEETSEGIYAASGSGSGDNDKGRCRFGRKNFKGNASDCVKCVLSGGTTVSNTPGQVPGHVTVTQDQCPDKMPVK